MSMCIDSINICSYLGKSHREASSIKCSFKICEEAETG